ncbi:TPA: hypothetical protein N0F65_008992 [Lagenidium giganteum]|uniref:Uncharacterized protein n=1 Tax=Lagenidium giganteum TaxID=4803 RepID=A0AAV2YRR2_9STRA|nr:TPA: hypothetical protein N0F65_008992 [Lagenidium giganteum]
MTTVAIDLREEMDESDVLNTRAPLHFKQKQQLQYAQQQIHPAAPSDSKAKFLIRALPRECNPTPVTAASAGAPATLLSSPSAHKLKNQNDAVEEALAADNPFDDLTEEKLQHLSGKQDLARVTSLQIAVNSTQHSVEVIGELLPSLQQLRLHNSVLSSFRDLGTSLHSLQSLWAMRCSIRDLDGISALTGLQELYLQHNSITDISPLTMHEEIVVLDLEGNQVCDIGQIEQLAFCPQLRSLNLKDNPVGRISCYRQIVANFLPQLEMLDGKPLVDEERRKLADSVIDAVIAKHQEDLAAEATDNELGADIIRSPRASGGLNGAQLARSSSSTRVGVETTSDPVKDDYGSSLTHGTDIVFAGNVTSALRRHRNETDPESPKRTSRNQQASGFDHNSDRPQTPARISITDTLDRANELENRKYKSRDAILNELKSWQMEAASWQLGVTHVAQDGTESTTKHIVKSHHDKRPNTSAGVMRNGKAVAEAFVEQRPPSSSRPKTPGSPTKSQRSSLTGQWTVDILILDDHDERRPCSPTKTPRGIYASSSTERDWNLDALSPKVDFSHSSWKDKLPSSRPATSQGRIHRPSKYKPSKEADHNSSDSDSDDFAVGRDSAPFPRKSSKKQPPGAFFNIVESLNAIDKWRDEMDDDSSIVNVRSDCLSPRRLTTPAVETSADILVIDHSSSDGHAKVPAMELGPANFESDERVVRWMKEKHKMVAETKTREGFRRFFRGIDAPRLERILQEVFKDQVKVRRRMQIMQGFFHGQLQ